MTGKYDERFYHHEMSGWARITPDGKWHQVDVVPRSGTHGPTQFPCLGVVVQIDRMEVMDYRWRPPSGQRCGRPFCQIDPGP